MFSAQGMMGGMMGGGGGMAGGGMAGGGSQMSPGMSSIGTTGAGGSTFSDIKLKRTLKKSVNQKVVFLYIILIIKIKSMEWVALRV